MKVVIVGAGIAGLTIGWRLAQAGASVEILERGLAGRSATWASAGMLAPVAEFGNEISPLTRFAHDARAAWPNFAAELESSSGDDIDFRSDGSLTLARSETRATSLMSLASDLSAGGMGAIWLSRSEVV